eukprot:35065-Eustigmatos_ZCMA.PRE.1
MCPAGPSHALSVFPLCVVHSSTRMPGILSVYLRPGGRDERRREEDAPVSCSPKRASHCGRTRAAGGCVVTQVPLHALKCRLYCPAYP